MWNFALKILLLAGLALSACAPPVSNAPEPAPALLSDPAKVVSKPRLLVVLVIDQMRADYLTRFAGQFQGGLKKLLTEGAVLTNASHRHAHTFTSPGHATLITGVHPSRHGIIANSWWSRETGKKIGASDDAQDGESPRLMLAPALGDWLKQASPASKVFAASHKSNSAILLGGHQANAAYWYEDPIGQMASGPYYKDAPAPWVAQFNQTQPVSRFFGRTWTPLPVPDAVLQELGVGSLDLPAFPSGFPHTFSKEGASGPDADFYRALGVSPFLDEQLELFAESLIRQEQLGQDEHADILALSFSSLDLVGHKFGPNSREVLDLLLRLDATLGRFLAFLEVELPGQVVVALSADHGVVPVPEERQLQGQPGARISDREMACLRALGVQLREQFGEGQWLFHHSTGMIINRQLLQARGVDPARFEASVIEWVGGCPSVVKVWTKSVIEKELAKPAQARHPSTELYANIYAPGRSPDFMIQFEEFFLESTNYTTSHGTPYAYDMRVPMVFWGSGLAAAQIDIPTATVDFAPTLASLGGFSAPDGLDGVDRRRLVQGEMK